MILHKINKNIQCKLLYLKLLKYLLTPVKIDRNNIKEPEKDIKNVQSLTTKQKEKTDTSQQVITSPTVGVTLLKSGNAAKDKRFFFVHN